MVLRIVLAIILLWAGGSRAAAQAIWEDYQGTNEILGVLLQDKPGPSYDNLAANALANLRTISANPANATRTGSSATIDYDRNQPTLCNTTQLLDGSYDVLGAGAACQADAQGRVLYALIKFPQAGLYTFGFAHDDQIDLDLSSDYANTAYRSATYDISVGNAAALTASDTTYASFAGTFRASAANACALLRLYWNNAGGRHYLRMQWTKPSAVTETVPASQLLNPGLAASASGCSGAIANIAALPLLVAKSVSPLSDPVSGSSAAKPIPGALLRYCILLTNPSTSAATSVLGMDPLPATLRYVANSLKSGTSCASATTIEDDDAVGADEADPVGASATGATVRLSAPSLAAGASVAFSLDATIH